MDNSPKKKIFNTMAEKLVKVCFDVGLSNNRNKVKINASNDLCLYMNEGWLFSDIVKCILDDPVYKYVNDKNTLNFQLSDTNQILPLHTIFLIAAFQYAVMKRENRPFVPNNPLFGEFFRGLSVCFTEDNNWNMLMNSSVEHNPFCKQENAQDVKEINPKNFRSEFMFHGSNEYENEGKPNPCPYILEVMMKFHLVSRIYRTDNHVPSDIKKAVQNSLEECMKTMSDLSKNEKSNKKQLPNLSDVETQDVCDQIKQTVENWFRCFVLKRSCGRLFSTLVHKKKNRENMPGGWFEKVSLENNNGCNHVTDLCYRDLLLLGNEKCKLKNIPKITTCSNLVVDEFGILDANEFALFLHDMFQILNIGSKFETFRSNEFEIADIIKLQHQFEFYRLNHDIGAKNATATGSIEQSAEKNIQYRDMVYLGRNPVCCGTSDVSPDHDKMIQWFTMWFGAKNNFKKIGDQLIIHDENMEIVDMTQQKEGCDVILCEFINRYIDSKIQCPIVRIPPEVRSIIVNLNNPSNYQAAIEAVTRNICEEYSAILGKNVFAAPEYGGGIMDYWDSWKNKSAFFMAALISAIHNCSYQPTQILTCTTKWLIQEHYVHKHAFPKAEILSVQDSELRKIIFPHTCLQWFCEMFKCDLSQKMKNDSKYSAYNIIRCVLEADSKYFNENRCRPYLWKKYRKEKSTFDYKHVVEHAICVILILLGVNYLHSSIFYNGVSPPLFGDADDDTKKSKGDADDNTKKSDEEEKSKDSKEVDVAINDAKTTTTTVTPATEAEAAKAAAATAATEAAKAAAATAATEAAKAAAARAAAAKAKEAEEEAAAATAAATAATAAAKAATAAATAAAAAAATAQARATAAAAEIEPEKAAKPTWTELFMGPRRQSEAEKEAL